METLAVQSRRLTTFEGLGCLLDMSVMYAQNNCISSFEFLEPQPKLKELHLARNRICDFKHAQEQPRLERLSLEDNPVTEHINYRVMCLVVFGSKLRYIDGQVVTARERSQAKRYSVPVVRALLRKGWLLDNKPRSPEEYEELLLSLDGVD